MNTTMPDGARDRLVAQIGEALFGQPGLTLMELAEKVNGARSSAPLGYVRAEAIKALREDDEVTGVMVHVDERTDSVPVYLSAQPSPGGQGHAPSIDYEDLLDQAKDLIHCGCSVNGAFEWLLEQLTDGEALAARQPVGQEPVAWLIHWTENEGSPEATTKASRAEAVGMLTNPPRIDPLYAVPPAQAVDLGPAVIPDTPEVRDILGRPNFWCSPWANVLRMRGDSIPRKAEEEQAAVIRFMLNHYLANGADWAEAAGAELDAIRKADSQAVGK